MANGDLEVNDAANNMEKILRRKQTISCVGTSFPENINIRYQNNNHYSIFLLNNSKYFGFVIRYRLLC